MAVSTFSRLQAGTKIRMKMHGSKMYGNEPYFLNGTFLGITDDEVHVDSDGQVLEFYRMGSSPLWRYGTSAEVVTVAEIL